MNSFVRPLGIAAAIIFLLIVLALVLGTTIQAVLAWTLLALAAAAIWAAAIFWLVHRRHTELEVLARDFYWATEIATGTVLLSVLGANYLVGSPLPKGAGFVLLAAAVLLQNVPLLLFLIDYYRPRGPKGKR